MKTITLNKPNQKREGFVISILLDDDTHIESFNDIVIHGFGLFKIEQDEKGYHAVTWGEQFKPWGNMDINKSPGDITLVSFHMIDDGYVQIYRNWIGED